jgi:hypothetical protein
MKAVKALLLAMTPFFAYADLSPDFQGVWLKQGYNEIIEIGLNNGKLYEITQVSCLEIEDGTLEEVEELLGNVQLNEAKDHFISLAPGDVTIYHFIKQPSLPTLCQTPETDDPEHNFEVLWHTFNENYAFFDLRNVDWDAQYALYRPQVTAETSDEALNEIFINMLTPLNDGHVWLISEAGFFSAGQDDNFKALRQEFASQTEIASVDEYIGIALNQFFQILIENYLNGQIKTAANEQLLWGQLNEDTGYLFINGMIGFSDEGEDAEDDLAALSTAMDQVMEDFKSMKAVVVDIRLNGGGRDSASLLIANRFADQQRLAFTKQAHNGFTEPQSVYVEPEEPFTGPVILLTSDAVASAAETFTLDMKALPHVIQVGEATEGIFSDIQLRTLPNEWTVGLSNEVYRAPDGTLYEGIGIPPDVAVPFLSQSDRAQGIDSGIETALSLLQAEKTPCHATYTPSDRYVYLPCVNVAFIDETLAVEMQGTTDLSQFTVVTYTGNVSVNQECQAYFADGRLHIPCVNVPTSVGMQAFEVDMDWIALSNPPQFTLLTVTPVQ